MHPFSHKYLDLSKAWSVLDIPNAGWAFVEKIFPVLTKMRQIDGIISLVIRNNLDEWQENMRNTYAVLWKSDLNLDG